MGNIRAMFNFTAAICALEKGFSVTRKSWKDEKRLKLFNGNIRFTKRIYNAWFDWSPTLEDIKSEDWMYDWSDFDD